MIDELLKPASDDDLRKFANGDSGIQWYRNIAAELLRRREADRWILNDERTPEVDEIVQWTHKSWKRVKEGYLTDTAHLKVWGGEYASVPKGAMWKPMPEPPEST